MFEKQLVMDRAAKHFSATSNVSGTQTKTYYNFILHYDGTNHILKA